MSGRGSAHPSRDPRLSPHDYWLCSALAIMLTSRLPPHSSQISPHAVPPPTKPGFTITPGLVNSPRQPTEGLHSP